MLILPFDCAAILVFASAPTALVSDWLTLFVIHWSMAPVHGKLVGKTPGPETKLDFDIYEVNNVDVLFEGLSGASLLEHILLWYQSKEMDIPWFTRVEGDQAEVRTLIRSPASRELQETTIASTLKASVKWFQAGRMWFCRLIPHELLWFWWFKVWYLLRVFLESGCPIICRHIDSHKDSKTSIKCSYLFFGRVSLGVLSNNLQIMIFGRVQSQ